MDFLSELARAIILRRWRKSLEIELSIWRRLMLELQLPRVLKPVSLFENPFFYVLEKEEFFKKLFQRNGSFEQLTLNKQKNLQIFR